MQQVEFKPYTISQSFNAGYSFKMSATVIAIEIRALLSENIRDILSATMLRDGDRF